MTTAEKIAAALPIARALLPPNATALERAILAAELARFADVDPSIIRTIWDPYGCPAPLLPFLAWALSVDVWDDAWPEIVKRDVIAAAPEVHRKKGTLLSVQRALVAMRLRARIKEWWQQAPNGQRGTFDVTVFVNQHIYDRTLPLLNERVQRNAIATLRATKPKSRAMNFSLGVGFTGKSGAANGAATMAVHSRTLYAGPDLNRRSVVGAADAAGAMAADVRSLIAAPDLKRRSVIGIAGRMAGLVVQHLSFVVPEIA